ncbi:hypothetical protein BBJ28_00008423 [Nothophytophthora sp. Chile5]|nr:hypothetical protein BBJ28_00008423 [Nothophytophthora sp. Chile5]
MAQAAAKKRREAAAAEEKEAAAPSKKAAGKKRRKVLENTKATEAAVESAESGVSSEEEATKGLKHHQGVNLYGPGSRKPPERYCHAKDGPSSMSEAEAEFCVKSTETSKLRFYRLFPDKTTVKIGKMVEKQTKLMQDILDTNRAILEELRTLNRAF